MKMEQPLLPEAAAAGTARTYWVVTQVKSNRVVYFTDDPDYAPLDVDWCYLSSYEGDLPRGMTLRNCWRWRFNGGIFSDTEGAKAPAKSAAERLIEANRKALLQILAEKVDLVRAQHAPTCLMGALVREAKQREATAFLAGDTAEPLPFLEATAAARNLPLADAAQMVLDRASVAAAALTESERVRETLKAAILAANTEEELLALRERLLADVYPQHSELFPFKTPKTEPADPSHPLPANQLRHEQARLRAQLKERINARRSARISDYLLDDVAVRHKGTLAESLLANRGQKKEGLDYSVLENYAKARGLSLVDASVEVLKELAETGRVVAETEKAKDSLLAEIARARTLDDIRRVAALIARTQP